MKILYFRCRGELFKVNKKGEIGYAYNGKSEIDFCKDWKFLGVSYHHWRNRIDLTLKEAFENPEKLIKGIVWDRDFGTPRIWSGYYMGKLPRITDAYIKEE